MASPSPQQSTCESGDLKSQLVENLAKNRENLNKEDHDHCGHHAKHNKRIGHSALDLLCDLDFLLIKSGKSAHHFVQASGLFTGADIGYSRGRKNMRAFHCVGKRARFFHVFVEKGKDLFSPG